jgi:hypothetical protein
VPQAAGAQSNAEYGYGGAGSGVADQWAHRERRYDRDQQGAVPMRREMPMDCPPQFFQWDYP